MSQLVGIFKDYYFKWGEHTLTRINGSIKSKAVLVFIVCSIFLFMGTGCKYTDKTLKTTPYDISESKIIRNHNLGFTLTGVYNDIGEMYEDSDCILSGVVKDVEYFQHEYILLRKTNVLVKKSYKGDVEKNTLISILENDGYLRVKTLYEEAKAYYEEHSEDEDPKKKEDYLYGITYMTDKKDIEDDGLFKLFYHDKPEDSKVGDELLLFLAKSSDDSYKDKKIQLFFGNRLSYPEGAYTTLGLWMGKFTKDGQYYKRGEWYYITDFSPDRKGPLNQALKIQDKYTLEEMENQLKELS